MVYLKFEFKFNWATCFLFVGDQHARGHRASPSGWRDEGEGVARDQEPRRPPTVSQKLEQEACLVGAGARGHGAYAAGKCGPKQSTCTPSTLQLWPEPPLSEPSTASRLGSLGEARHRAQPLGRVVRGDPGQTLQGPAQQTDAPVTGCSSHVVCDGSVVSCTLLQSVMN